MESHVVGCAKLPQLGCHVLFEDDHHAGAMTRPRHATKKNVNATLAPAGLTKCRQASAGISPFDRAAACGGGAVIPGCDDGGFILRNAPRRNFKHSRPAYLLAHCDASSHWPRDFCIFSITVRQSLRAYHSCKCVLLTICCKAADMNS